MDLIRIWVWFLSYLAQLKAAAEYMRQSSMARSRLL